MKIILIVLNVQNVKKDLNYDLMFAMINAIIQLQKIYKNSHLSKKIQKLDIQKNLIAILYQQELLLLLLTILIKKFLSQQQMNITLLLNTTELMVLLKLLILKMFLVLLNPMTYTQCL